MMRCSKTGLNKKDWKTILDIINVFDPNDIMHVYPEMGTPEYMQDVHETFKLVLKHCERLDHEDEMRDQQSLVGPREEARLDESMKDLDKTLAALEPDNVMTNEQSDAINEAHGWGR